MYFPAMEALCSQQTVSGLVYLSFAHDLAGLCTNSKKYFTSNSAPTLSLCAVAWLHKPWMHLALFKFMAHLPPLSGPRYLCLPCRPPYLRIFVGHRSLSPFVCLPLYPSPCLHRLTSANISPADPFHQTIFYEEVCATRQLRAHRWNNWFVEGFSSQRKDSQSTEVMV